MAGRTLIIILAAIIAVGGIATAFASMGDDDPQRVSEVEVRKDDATEDEAVVDDTPDNDPDPDTRARAGDGDDTRGDDGTRGGENTRDDRTRGDGDNTRGDDGTRGGENTRDRQTRDNATRDRDDRTG